MAPDSEGMGQTRALLLGLLVVAGTAGAIYFMMSGSDETAPQTEQPDALPDEVVEVAPLMPRGGLKNTSWRKNASAGKEPEAEDNGTFSLIDVSDLGKDPAERRLEKSIEKSVEQIYGLGVVVDKTVDEEDGDPKKKKGRDRK